MVGGVIAGGVAIGAVAVGTFALGVSAGAPVLGAGIGAYVAGNATTYAISKMTGSWLIDRAEKRELQEIESLKEKLKTKTTTKDGEQQTKTKTKDGEQQTKTTTKDKVRNFIDSIEVRGKGVLKKFVPKSKSNGISKDNISNNKKNRDNSKNDAIEKQ